MRAGLAQRFGPPRRGERLTLLPLSAGALLSVFYAMFIIWAPDTRYAGSLGPFSNPSIVTCALLVSAFCAALSLRGTAASTLALTAVGAEIAIGILSAVNGWQGPGGAAVVLFAGIGILAGSFRRGSSLVIGCLIVIAATATTVIVGWATAGLGQFSMVSASASALVILLVLVAAGLSVRRMRRPAARE